MLQVKPIGELPTFYEFFNLLFKLLTICGVMASLLMERTILSPILLSPVTLWDRLLEDPFVSVDGIDVIYRGHQ